MSTQQITPEAANPPKSMKGKYDKRYRIKADSVDKGKRINAGDKPQWAKNLTRNTAAVVLKQASAKELWLELLRANDRRLQFEVLRYLTDRLEGKPFVAENPNAKPQANNILNDNRLQIAIQQLVPAKQERKSKKTNAIQAVSDVKQLTTSDTTQQSYVEHPAQVIDSTQDQSE